MNKEYLEALEHIYYGSQGYGETDKYYKYLKEYLESINNSNPSEALEELIDMIEYFTRLDYVEPIVRNEIHDKFKDIYWHKLPHLDSIKEALIKAEKEHNSLNLLMQELDCKDFADLRKYARCGYEKLNNK